MPKKIIRLSRNDFIYPALAILSLLLIVFQYQGMNQTLQIFPNAINQPLLVNDRVNGGRSIGSVITTDELIRLDCKTQKAANVFAFCSFILPITTDEQGIDLSNYQSMDIWLNMEAKDNAKDSVLVYLLNSEENNNGEMIKRSNLRTINPAPGMTYYQLKLDSFFVPSWWLFANANQISDSGELNLSNITAVQVSTGDSTRERIETISIARIELKGKIITAQQLYSVLLVAWITVIIVTIIHGLFRLHKKLNNSNQKAMKLQKLNQLLSIEKNKYKTMAKIDPLTQALNRAGIRKVLDRAVKDHENNATPYAIIMLDIDHFKAVNDNFGHDFGDRVLIKLVATIQENTREGDSLARWGGEEFILICPGITQETALAVAEKHRKAIADTPFFEGEITCSFGVSELDSDVENSFKQADAALYKAKEQGRNQVANN